MKYRGLSLYDWVINPRAAVIANASNWILITTFWRDEGEWVDTEFWMD